jgi:hypothetical protein
VSNTMMLSPGVNLAHNDSSSQYSAKTVDYFLKQSPKKLKFLINSHL